MRKFFYLLLLSNLAIGQVKETNPLKSDGASKTLLSTNCKDITSYANDDIKNDEIAIFVQGGIAPKIFKSDPIFEKKYSIRYNDLGCIGNKCAELYNQAIFDYLTKTFGNKWAKTVNTNAVGLKKWQIKTKIK